jgi:long-subunit fatty acid transport protein
VNLDVQTGVAERTMVFGSMRWVDWSEFQLSPATFSGLTAAPLASYPKDIVTYTLGVGHQVTDKLSVVGALSYEDEGNRLGSALGPVNGFTNLTVAAIHETERHRISLGVSHFWLRDADPQAGGSTVGAFRDNRLVAVELKVGFKF